MVYLIGLGKMWVMRFAAAPRGQELQAFKRSVQKLRGLQFDGKTPRRGATPAPAAAAQGAEHDHRESPGAVRQRLEGSFEVEACRGALPAVRQSSSLADHSANRLSMSAGAGGASTQAFHALQLAVDGKRFGTATPSLGAAAGTIQARPDVRRPGSGPPDQAHSGVGRLDGRQQAQEDTLNAANNASAPVLGSSADNRAAPRSSLAPEQAGQGGGLGAPKESPTKAVLERHRRQPAEGGRASSGRGQPTSPRKRVQQVL